MCTALLPVLTVLRNETQVLKTRTASRGFKLPGGWWSGWFFFTLEGKEVGRGSP